MTPEGEESVVRGTCEGQILTECLEVKGSDTIQSSTYRNLKRQWHKFRSSQKNVLSHRADAFAKLQTILMNLV